MLDIAPPAGATALDAFFFDSAPGSPLFGVWRMPDATHDGSSVSRVCVVLPPFGEEEKCARRVLTTLLMQWREAGIASLLFAPRGMGDAGGDFADATLQNWLDDARAACREARHLAPHAALTLLGLRLGAALAVQLAPEVGADALILLEPVLDGKRYLSQLESRQRLRAQMMKAEGGPGADVGAPAANPQILNSSILDLDGWPLGEELRGDLRALNVAMPSRFEGQSIVVQIGPRPDIAPPLRDFAGALGAQTRGVVMPAFWNANDETDPAPLIEALPPDVVPPPQHPTPDVEDRTSEGAATSPIPSPDGEHPVLLRNAAGQQLVGVWHEPQGAVSISDLTVIMLHGWSGYRIGPHQMLTRAARELAREGCGVLRFDFAGRGDSDGTTSHATLATMREDLRAALAWCRETAPQQFERVGQRFVLLGICAGCEIAFAGADEAGVAGLVLWSAPVFAAGESSERAAKRRGHFLREYARKLLRVETYRKLLSGRVDTRGVSKALGGKNAGELKNAEGDVPGRLPVGWKAARMAGFARAARPCLLVYGTADPTAVEAEAFYRARCDEAGISPQVNHVAGANHSYYGLGWEREVFDITRDWLQEV